MFSSKNRRFRFFPMNEPRACVFDGKHLKIGDLFEENTSKSAIFSRKTPQHRRFFRGKHLKIGDFFEENISKSAIFSRKTPQHRRFVRGKHLNIGDFFEETISKSTICSRETPIPRRELEGAPGPGAHRPGPMGPWGPMGPHGPRAHGPLEIFLEKIGDFEMFSSKKSPILRCVPRKNRRF